MAPVKIAAVWVTLWVVAAYTQSNADSLFVDSLVVLPDSVAADTTASVTSTWLLPLTVIAATGAIFALLFTTRSK